MKGQSLKGIRSHESCAKVTECGQNLVRCTVCLYISSTTSTPSSEVLLMGSLIENRHIFFMRYISQLHRYFCFSFPIACAFLDTKCEHTSKQHIS